jgi:hypothetical protein
MARGEDTCRTSQNQAGLEPGVLAAPARQTRAARRSMTLANTIDTAGTSVPNSTESPVNAVPSSEPLRCLQLPGSVPSTVVK